MTRIFLKIAGTVTCLLVPVVCIAQEHAREAAEFREVAPGLYFNYDHAISNSVVLITDEGVVVVDTRMHPRDAEELLTEIRMRTHAPIRWVINTQFHGDHYMGNAVFRDEGAIFIQHRDTRAVILERFHQEVAQRPFDNLGLERDEVELVLPDVLFDSNLTLEIGGITVEVIFLGAGQNKGDTLVYFPHAKALHMGGVFHNRSWANTSYTPSIDGWLEVLEKTKSIGAELYLPPHGDTASRSDVDAFSDFLVAIRDGVEAAIDDGLTAEETLSRLTFEEYSDWRGYDRRDRNLDAIYQLLTGGGDTYYVPSNTAGSGRR